MRRKLLVLCSAVLLLMLGISASTMIRPVSGDNGLGSDWPTFGHDPAHTGHTNTTGPGRPSIIWRFRTSVIHHGGIYGSSPAVVNNKVYVGAWDYNVYCVDALTGSQIWVYTTDGIISSSPAVSNGRIYIGSNDGYLYCLDADNGTLIWRYRADTGVFSSPTVINDKVYINAQYTYCLDALNGSLVWSFSKSGSAPAVADGRLYLGSWDGHIYCLNADNGILVWKHHTNQTDFTPPRAVDGKVYIGSHRIFEEDSGRVYCLDAFDGVLQWKVEIGSYMQSSLAVADGKVYLGSFDHHVFCLDANTGDLIWSYQTGDSIGRSSPAVADGKVYVGSHDGDIYCFNANNGSIIWILPIHDWQYSPPAIVEGRLYIGSYRHSNEYYGYLYCIGEGTPTSDSVPPTINRVDYSPKHPDDIDNVVVEAEVWDDVGISSVTLRHIEGFGWRSVKMSYVGGTTYRAVIGNYHIGIKVSFRIEATDTSGNTAASSLFKYEIWTNLGIGTNFTLNSKRTLNVTVNFQSSQPILAEIAGVGLPSSPPPQLNTLGSAFKILANISSGLNITITYYYTDEELSTLGIDESTLVLCYWSENDNSWNKLPTTLDMVNNELKATVEYLGIFAAFGQSITPEIGYDDDLSLAGAFTTLITMLILAAVALGVSGNRKPRSEPAAEPEVLSNSEREISPEGMESKIGEVEPSGYGLSIEPTCSHCNHRNPAEAIFCMMCGKYIGKESSAAS